MKHENPQTASAPPPAPPQKKKKEKISGYSKLVRE